MRFSPFTLGLILIAALAAGCPSDNAGGQSDGGQAPSSQVQSLGSVVLIRSDLGIGDGEFVRELDAALEAQAASGRIEYTPVGGLPQELKMTMGFTDVGLPKAGSDEPGTMTLQEAEDLVRQAGECDLLVLSSQLLVQAALDAAGAGDIQPRSILVLDDYLVGEGWEGAAVPVYTVGYDVRDVAFLCGVAVAKSSNNGMFIMLASKDDPHADEFLQAAEAGAKYQTNGAATATMVLPGSEEAGVVDPEAFSQALGRIDDEYGEQFMPNHYVISLGRATPAILQYLTGDPNRAYVAGAYADYTISRPQKVLGCIEKHPGVAIGLLLDGIDSLDELAGEFVSGLKVYGLADGAVGFTDFSLYSRYNPDGADIRKTLEKTQAQILAGEMDIDY